MHVCFFFFQLSEIHPRFGILFCVKSATVDRRQTFFPLFFYFLSSLELWVAIPVEKILLLESPLFILARGTAPGDFLDAKFHGDRCLSSALKISPGTRGVQSVQSVQSREFEQ